MKKRNPILIFFLALITGGIYEIVWFVITRREMNSMGAGIPSAWFLIIPFVNIWWLWKYSEGVDTVTKAKISTALSFVLLFLLGNIGIAIVQHYFNQLPNEF